MTSVCQNMLSRLTHLDWSKNQYSSAWYPVCNIFLTAVSEGIFEYPYIVALKFFNYYMVLFKNAIRHSGQKNITDTPLGPALQWECSKIISKSFVVFYQCNYKPLLKSLDVLLQTARLVRGCPELCVHFPDSSKPGPRPLYLQAPVLC